MKAFIHPFLAGFLALIGVELKAQTIEGSVIDDKSEEPLIGANLYVKSDWRKGTSTNLDGKFKLKLEQMPDTLIVSFIGYQEQQIPLNESTQKLQIRLLASNINIGEVIIRGERLIAEEFTYRKVNRLDIYTNPSAKADPLLAVNSLPSTTTLDESANISFRGSSPAETGVFLNNVPIYDAVRLSQLNGIGTFSIFNTDIVDNMQVFPGNPPLEYGNATSGLIAIQTAEQVPEEASNSATISLASFGLLTTRPIGKKTGITVFSNYQPSALIRGVNYTSLKDIKRFQSNDLGVHIVHKTKSGDIFKIFNYALYENYDYHFRAPTFDGMFNQQRKRNFTVVNYRKQADQHVFSANGNLSFSKASFGYADTDISVDNRDVFFSVNYQYLATNYEFKTGLNYDFRHQLFDGIFYEYEFALGEGFPTQPGYQKENLHRPEAFVYSKYYVGDKLIIGGGVRKNLPRDEQEHYLSTQLNTRYELSDNSCLALALGKYNKYNLPQNDNEQPKLIQSNQVSLDYQFSKGAFEMSASIFAKENFLPESSTQITGGELFVKGRFLHKLTGQASITYINGETKSDTEETYPMNYDLDYFIKGNLEYQFDHAWSIATTFLIRQGRYYQPLIETSYREDLEIFEPRFSPLTHQQRLPGYSTFDLNISRIIPINEKATIIAFGSVSNIFNHQNVRDYTYNFGYTEYSEVLFSQRAMYFGVVVNF